jgi:mercuric ion transport protein
MRRILVGWFLAATGFLACPCHLVITLPLAVALLGGTALGGWIAGHPGMIFAGASIYFIGALLGGATLLLAGKSTRIHVRAAAEYPDDGMPRTAAEDCCTPPAFRSAAADEIPVEQADTAPAGSIDSLEPTHY